MDYFVQDENEKDGISDKIQEIPEKGLDLMSKDNLLKKRLQRFLKFNKGTDAKLNDPSNPKIGSQGKHLD